jgi:cystatin-C
VSTKTGQWVDIENVADPYVQDLGKWAVMEHNSRTGEDLQFDRVFGGSQQQDVAGMYYFLAIKTTGGPSPSYEANLFASLPQLNSFKPL